MGNNTGTGIAPHDSQRCPHPLKSKTTPPAPLKPVTYPQFARQQRSTCAPKTTQIASSHYPQHKATSTAGLLQTQITPPSPHSISSFSHGHQALSLLIGMASDCLSLLHKNTPPVQIGRTFTTSPLRKSYKRGTHRAPSRPYSVLQNSSTTFNSSQSSHLHPIGSTHVPLCGSTTPPLRRFGRLRPGLQLWQPHAPPQTTKRSCALQYYPLLWASEPQRLPVLPSKIYKQPLLRSSSNFCKLKNHQELPTRHVCYRRFHTAGPFIYCTCAKARTLIGRTVKYSPPPPTCTHPSSTFFSKLTYPHAPGTYGEEIVLNTCFHRA